jgi:formylglycine-generating enzyme required for sulfatase activity
MKSFKNKKHLKIIIRTVFTVIMAVMVSCENMEMLNVAEITLDKNYLRLPAGDTEVLTATVKPDNATDKSIYWESSHPEIATVDGNGKVTAVAASNNIECEIFAIAKDNRLKQATCVVSVYVPGVGFSDEPEMVSVEGGTFTMGGYGTLYQVTLGSFNIGKYEVTQGQWAIRTGSNPSYFKGDNYPVENVSWDDVQDFIIKLNAATGKNYRLPTEAEWEYAARGGNQSKGYDYSGSNTLDDVAWHFNNSGEHTHPVGEKAPNELGIYDMSGNVCEWCSDIYGDYPSTPQTNPQGPSKGIYRVLRGGSWYDRCDVGYRNSTNPYSYSNRVGFRLVLP